MFAIIETGGKQYRVAPEQKLKIEKVEVAAGASFSFDKVLLIADGENVKIGTPYIVGGNVAAKIVREGRADKEIVFKYHSKTRYKKKRGHRQPFTEVEIVSIKG